MCEGISILSLAQKIRKALVNLKLLLQQTVLEFCLLRSVIISVYKGLKLFLVHFISDHWKGHDSHTLYPVVNVVVMNQEGVWG